MTRRKLKDYDKLNGRQQQLPIPDLVVLKFCSQCGKELPKNSKAHHCPYCGGTLTTIQQVKS